MSVLASVLLTLRSSFRSRAALQIEVLALRHLLGVLERSRGHRVRLTRADRLLWAWISQTWTGWRATLVLVKPETVIAWHVKAFGCSGLGRAGAVRVGQPSSPISAP